MSDKNTELITTFYQAFVNGDAEKMISCYHDDIVFEDPAFGALEGEQAKEMWRMLLHRAKGTLKITFSDVQGHQTGGNASWKAEYIFSKTNRKIVNHIQATFKCKNGKILMHTDSFDLWKWSHQALGINGLLLGWTPFMKKQIQKQTNQLLDEWIKNKK